MPGLNLAEQHVAVGDGQRPAAAAGCGARIGARAFRVRRAAAHRPAADWNWPSAATVRIRSIGARMRVPATMLVIAFEPPGIMADVGRGAAHTRPMSRSCSVRRGATDHADDAGLRGPKDRIAAVERRGRCEPARAFHELRTGVVAELVQNWPT